MLSKSLIHFFVDGWSCVPFLLFTWGQTMVEVMKIMVASFKRSPALQADSLLTELQGKPTMDEVMKIMVTSFKRSHACTAPLSAPTSAAGHH